MGEYATEWHLGESPNRDGMPPILGVDPLNSSQFRNTLSYKHTIIYTNYQTMA